MPQHCEGHQSYIGTAEFQSFAFHSLTTMEIPIHVFAAYVIIFKTPSKMKSVKWALFNLHVWSAFLDVSLSFLTSPYIFFPSTAGYGLGFLTFLGISPAYQTALVIAEIGVTVVSTLVVFENRYSILTFSTPFASRVRKFFIGLIYLFAITYFIPFIYLIPDQKTAVDVVLQRLPTLRCIYSGPVYVVTLDATAIGFVTAGKLTVEFGAIGILVLLTCHSIYLQTRKSSLSRATIVLQKKFFVALMIQTAIPVVVVIFPLVCCANALVQNYFNQAANNICFLIICSHGLFSTIAMLMIHEPYRNATLPCLTLRERKLTRATSVVESVASARIKHF